MIFILGGRGFVGSAFARHCHAQGRDCTIIDRDNYASLVGQSCDIFVNANGNSSKPLAQKEPLREFDASVRSVRSSLVDFRFNTYIHLSSCDVYADCTSPETTREDQALDVSRQSPYGFHKFLAEQCVRHAAPRWIILRMGGFVGPGLRKNAIYDILHGPKLWLHPDSELQYMPTDSLAAAALGLAAAGHVNEVFNTCGRGLVKLADVMRWAGREVPIDAAAKRVRYEVGIAKIEQVMPMPPTDASVRAFVESSLQVGAR
ncbi:MAG: NAD-dependent epimerase/dehydratase family protein [Phycisphaerales bacterium]|nr:NAD-dependent epimerase/dehydratase family protein [Phycisphaerales bacterium]